MINVEILKNKFPEFLFINDDEFLKDVSSNYSGSVNVKGLAFTHEGIIVYRSEDSLTTIIHEILHLIEVIDTNVNFQLNNINKCFDFLRWRQPFLDSYSHDNAVIDSGNKTNKKTLRSYVSEELIASISSSIVSSIFSLNAENQEINSYKKHCMQVEKHVNLDKILTKKQYRKSYEEAYRRVKIFLDRLR